jgi:hypothetical protein
MFKLLKQIKINFNAYDVENSDTYALVCNFLKKLVSIEQLDFNYYSVDNLHMIDAIFY